MRTSPVARRYARALLELAQEQKQMPKIKRDLDALAAAWTASDELRGVFENPGVTVEMRLKVVEGLAMRMGLSPLTKNTLLLMTSNGRFQRVAEVAQTFADMADSATGTVVAEVTTAAAMPATFYTRLQGELEKATGHKVTLEKKEDPSLIAGVLTRVGDKVYDGSVRNRLSQLRETLLA